MKMCSCKNCWKLEPPRGPSINVILKMGFLNVPLECMIHHLKVELNELSHDYVKSLIKQLIPVLRAKKVLLMHTWPRSKYIKEGNPKCDSYPQMSLLVRFEIII